MNPKLHCPHCTAPLERFHAMQSGPLRPLRCKACDKTYIAGGLLPVMFTLGLALGLSGHIEGLGSAIGLVTVLMLLSMAFLFLCQPRPAVHRTRIGVLMMVFAVGPPLANLVLRLVQRG